MTKEQIEKEANRPEAIALVEAIDKYAAMVKRTTNDDVTGCYCATLGFCLGAFKSETQFGERIPLKVLKDVLPIITKKL